jgi:Ca2+-binding EF-hand superfamily protein
MKHSNFNQDEFTLRNIFRNFDVNRDGTLSEPELQGLSSKLGLQLT